MSEYIDKLKAVCAAATGGPWEIEDGPSSYEQVPDGCEQPACITEGDGGPWLAAMVSDCVPNHEENAALIVLLANARDEIVAVVEAAQLCREYGQGHWFDVEQCLDALAAKIEGQA